MPIRFKPDGTFEFDTIEEAIAWRDQLAKQAALPPRGSASPPPAKAPAGGEQTPRPARETPTRRREGMPAPAVQRDMDLFLDSLGDNASSVMRALADAHPGWIGTAELAEKVELEATQLGPIFRSIFVRGKNHGYAEDELVERTETTVKDDRSRERQRSQYRLSDKLAAEMKAAFRGVK